MKLRIWNALPTQRLLRRSCGGELFDDMKCCLSLRICLEKVGVGISGSSDIPWAKVALLDALAFVKLVFALLACSAGFSHLRSNYGSLCYKKI